MNVLLGFAIGIPFGVVLDRGQFCMNRALREAVRGRNPALLRSYLLALAIQTIGVHLGAALGWVHIPDLPLAWGAAIIGGVIFGWGMGWALG